MSEPEKDTAQTPPLIKQIVVSPENCYFTYPHANGFLPDGRTAVLARTKGNRTEFLAFNPEESSTSTLSWLEGVKMYYDISSNGLLGAVANNSIVVMDVSDGKASEPRVLWESTAPWRLGDLFGITADGQTAYVDFHDYNTPERHQIRAFATDALMPEPGEVILEKNWLLNHVHPSPYNDEWIFFSHEGQKVTDRMWNWNAKASPEGQSIFNQLDAEGKPLYIGHELAMHHKLAMLAVAYGNSPGSPRGLYEVEALGDEAQQQVRLLSEGNRDLHCNISRDGRWAVVDTMGPSDAPGPPLDGWITVKDGSVSDVLIVNLETGARQFLVRSHMDRKHPWHLHPHISPDGRWVIYNDGIDYRVNAIEIDQGALETFLSSEKGTDSALSITSETLDAS